MTRSLLLSASLVAALTSSLAACARSQDLPDEPEAPVVTPPPLVSAVDPPRIALEPMFGGATFQRPVDALQAPGDPDSWFIVEQRGLVLRLRPDGADWLQEPFLDLRERVNRTGNEEGLLGLAFSPHFGQAGHPHARALYVDYSVRPGKLSRLVRLHVGEDGVVDTAHEEVLMEVPQPWRNHNGGDVEFGPDGYLYYSLGDGGAGGDPHDNGQDPHTWLGSILRLDVDPGRGDGERPYGIPADNPFADGRAGAAEVWAYGLRNAWRFSFDRETGEMWAGDVGQNKYELVYRVQPGGNHGWRLLEGFHRFGLEEGAAVPEGLVPPVHTYGRLDGLSITGGYVYRGQAIPSLTGWYVFGDYALRHLWALRPTAEGSVEHTLLAEKAVAISSFGQGHDGELVVVHHMGGPVSRIVPASDV